MQRDGWQTYSLVSLCQSLGRGIVTVSMMKPSYDHGVVLMAGGEWGRKKLKGIV